MTAPLVLGAGPAGCAAAIELARAGVEPTLIDRDAEVGDALCGGFMSWRTAETVRDLGVDLADLGAHRVTELALFAGARTATAPLPSVGYGLSRYAFDTALRKRAVEAGAHLEIDRARSIGPGLVGGEARAWHGDALFLASGKHDVRGESRPRVSNDPALGLRIRLPAGEQMRALVGERIELHLFDGGYAGIVLQEDGSANVCLAVRKSALAGAGGNPRDLLDRLAGEHPHFGDRMAGAASELPIDTVGSVPYGYIARETQPSLYRLGDQAAVIPSLAGEGMSIALASGIAAARAFRKGKSAPDFQREFAARATPPVQRAERIWYLAENERVAPLALGLLGLVPRAADWAMRRTRIAA